MSAQSPDQQPPPDKYAKSAALYEEAKKVIPGGASSILRWASYDPHPLFMKSGAGSKITDVDGNTFIDYLLAYGVLINGHAHPKVVERIKRAVDEGTMFGTPTEIEVDLAKKFKQFVPTSDEVVFGNCITNDTQILTDTLVRPMGDIEAGDRVLSSDGIPHTVIAKTSKLYSGQIYEIYPSHNNKFPIRCTADHRILAIRKGKYANVRARGAYGKRRLKDGLPTKATASRLNESLKLEAEWIEAKDLRKGDVLLRSLAKIHGNVETIKFYDFGKRLVKGKVFPEEIPITEPFLRLCGFYLAEGSTDEARTKTVRFSFNRNETEYVNQVVADIKEVFLCGAKVRQQKGKRVTEVIVDSVSLGSFFGSLFGFGAENKKVPAFLMSIPPEKQAILLDAYWKGDGSQSKQPRWTISTTSVSLALHSREMLIRSSHDVPSVHYYERKDVPEKTRYSYTIAWTKNASRNVGYRNHDFIYSPIRKIKIVQYNGIVSDLLVDTQHDFATVCGIVHNSGSEATANAIRIARAASGKDMIVKAEGGFHGQHDYAMISVESPPLVAGLEDYPRALPYTAGIPALVLDTVLVSPWNNLKALERIVKRHKNDVAGIIVEPIMGNCGVIPPLPDYLKGVREIANANDALLIFDEVITGFRVSPGGAQEMYGVVPDISTWGKALGGGVPISAVSGKREYMDLLSPGKVSHGGTYNANPLSATGALANLEVLEEGDYHPIRYLKDYTKMLLKGLDDTAKASQHKVIVQGAPGMFSVFFTKQDRILSYRDSLKVDWEKYRALYKLLLERGVFVHPDNFERVAVSTVHTQEDMQKTVDAFGDSLKVLKQRYD